MNGRLNDLSFIEDRRCYSGWLYGLRRYGLQRRARKGVEVPEINNTLLELSQVCENKYIRPEFYWPQTRLQEIAIPTAAGSSVVCYVTLFVFSESIFVQFLYIISNISRILQAINHCVLQQNVHTFLFTFSWYRDVFKIHHHHLIPLSVLGRRNLFYVLPFIFILETLYFRHRIFLTVKKIFPSYKARGGCDISGRKLKYLAYDCRCKNIGAFFMVLISKLATAIYPTI